MKKDSLPMPAHMGDLDRHRMQSTDSDDERSVKPESILTDFMVGPPVPLPDRPQPQWRPGKAYRDDTDE